MSAFRPSGTFANAVAPSDAYDLVTARVIAALDRGTAPWRRPWHGLSGAPANAVTNRAYRGVNVVLLGLSPFADHRWLTYRQAHALGATPRQGESPTEVVFWKLVDLTKREEAAKDKETGEKPEAELRRFPLLRTYRVWNAEQVEGLRLPPVAADREARLHERIPRAESVLRHMPGPPAVSEGQRSAWYAPAEDLVGVPALGAFHTPDAYYATLFHELGHATGHPARLDRRGVRGAVRFGSEDYGMEELVAELASAFVCAAVGLDNSLADNSAAYVQGWLRALRNDRKALVVAAARAQRAAEWIFGRTKGLAD